MQLGRRAARSMRFFFNCVGASRPYAMKVTVNRLRCGKGFYG